MRNPLVIVVAMIVSGAIAVGPIAGQTESTPNESLIPAFEFGVGCDGGSGIRYDDGTFEAAYGWNPVNLFGEYVMRLTLPGANSLVNAVCICWRREASVGSDLAVDFAVVVYDDDGPGGAPGTLLRSQDSGIDPVISLESTFVRVEFDPPLQLNSQHAYVGGAWSPLHEDLAFFICADQNGPGGQPAYGGISATSPPSLQLGGSSLFPSYRALGIRAEAAEIPPPPAGPWLKSPEFPGYQFKVQITSGANVRQGTAIECVPDSLCVAGAVADRSEIFLRIVGPKPNGFLHLSILKFSTSQVEVWAQHIASGRLRYHKLPNVPSDTAVLPGVVDKEAFLP